MARRTKTPTKKTLTSRVRVKPLPTMTSTTKGTRFENEVEALYRLLGYSVSRDVTSLGGKQTDLVIERSVPGAPPIRIFVECKAHSTRSLTVAEVRQFVADFVAVNRNDAFTGGVLVTKRHLSRQARGALTHRSCRALSYVELVSELLNVDASLNAYTARYQQQEINLSYIPQRARTAGATDVILMDDIERWLGGDGNLYVILGDFGTGKTTCLERLKFNLAAKRSKKPDLPVPIYIPLRNYESAANLETFVEQQLRNELSLHVPYQRLLQFLESGQLLLLLDGFDEMGQQIDSRRRRDNFKALAPFLLASPKSILTCRPAYFVTDAELGRVLGQLKQFTDSSALDRVARPRRRSHDSFLAAAEKALPARRAAHRFPRITRGTINEFTEQDVDSYVRGYIKRHVGAGDGELTDLRERIRSTYDLEDLARRPILLNLIVRTVPSLPKEREASPAVIYAAYTDTWMQHDYSKGEVRMLITATMKRRFMQVLAWEMYSAGVVEILHSDLPARVRRFFGSEGAMSRFLATDIQACSFLVRDPAGRFRFSHKSFMEYFAASYVRDCILDDDLSVLRTKRLSAELYFFLGDMIRSILGFSNRLRRVFGTAFAGPGMREGGDVFRANLLGIYSRARGSLPRKRFNGVQVEDLEFRSNNLTSSFVHSTWTDTSFLDCSFKGLELSDVIVRNVSIIGGRISDVMAKRVRQQKRGANGFGLRVSGVRIVKLHVRDETALELRDCRMRASTLRATAGAVKLKACDVDGIDFQQTGARIAFEGTSVAKSTFRGIGTEVLNPVEIVNAMKGRWVDEYGAHKANWANTSFEGCVFCWWDFSSTDLTDCVFENCIFVACRFRDKKQLRSEETHAKRCRFAGTSVPPPTSDEDVTVRKETTSAAMFNTLAHVANRTEATGKRPIRGRKAAITFHGSVEAALGEFGKTDLEKFALVFANGKGLVGA